MLSAMNNFRAGLLIKVAENRGTVVFELYDAGKMAENQFVGFLS